MRVSVEGTRLFFDVAGASHVPDSGRMAERPVTLVVHGGPGMDHSLLKPLFLPMAEHAQVVWIDLRGHGRSDPVPEGEWSLDRWAGDLVAFCDAVGLERPVLAGASVGGTASALAAARSPGRFAGLVLTSTPTGHRVKEMLAVFERLGGAEAREVASRHWTQPSPEAAAEYQRVCLPLYAREPLPPDVMARAILRPEIGAHFYASAEWRAFDLCAHAPAIDCPTLVVSGADDPVAPNAVARQLVDALPPGLGELLTIREGRHVLFQDAPDELRTAVAHFVADRHAKR
jgi:proline iminopeptidase